MTDDVGTGVITKTITIKNDPDVLKTSSSSNGFAGGG
jgi:hypothetical protein